MSKPERIDASLFILTTNERMIKYGLYPEEFDQAIEMDKTFTTKELQKMCRETGLPTGGEKKKLIASLIMDRREGSKKSPVQFFNDTEQGIKYAEDNNLKFAISATGKKIIVGTEHEIDNFMYSNGKMTEQFIKWTYE